MRTGNTMPLKYLFTATYADGRVFVQPADDASQFEPGKRSAFFDALRFAVSSPMIRFELNGNGHQYAVDLRDGHFEIDGVAFLMHDRNELPHRLKLIFWREHTHHKTLGGKQFEDPLVYQIGWEGDVALPTKRVEHRKHIMRSL